MEDEVVTDYESESDYSVKGKGIEHEAHIEETKNSHRSPIRKRIKASPKRKSHSSDEDCRKKKIEGGKVKAQDRGHPVKKCH